MSLHVLLNLSVLDEFFAGVVGELRLQPALTAAQFTGIAYREPSDAVRQAFDNIVLVSDCIRAHSHTTPNELVQLEHRYGTRFAELVHAERHLTRAEPRARVPIVRCVIDAIVEAHQQKNVSVIISEGLDDSISIFLRDFANTLDIPFVYPINSRLASRMHLSNSTDTTPLGFHDWLHAGQSETDLAATRRFLENYVFSQREPDYMNMRMARFRPVEIEDLSVFFKYLRGHLSDHNSWFYSEPPHELLKRRFERIKTIRAYRRNLRFSNMPELERDGYRVLLWPLQLYPEAATLVQGRWIHDQPALIKIVSRVLPADVVIAVKEHKVALGRRAFDFYEQIAQLHNVRFLQEDAKPFELLSACAGVVTISSSMGLEALMTNKPVITFGDAPYNSVPGVILARDVSRLQEYVDHALGFKGYPNDVVARFFSSWLEHSFEMSGFSPEQFTQNHVEVLAAQLIRHLGLTATQGR